MKQGTGKKQLRHLTTRVGYPIKVSGSGSFTFHSPHLYLTGPEGEALFVNAVPLPYPFLLHASTEPSPNLACGLPISRDKARKCGIVTNVQRRKTMMRRKRFRDDHQWWPRTPTTGVIGRRNDYHSCEFGAWNLLQHSQCMNERVQTAATEKPPHTNLELQARSRAVNVKLRMNE